MLQERVFDNCGDIEDLPLKSSSKRVRNPSNISYPEIPTISGKRRHQDNIIIVIDNDNDDEKFVAKKQRVVSHGSTMTQSHSQYSSPSFSSKAVCRLYRKSVTFYCRTFWQKQSCSGLYHITFTGCCYFYPRGS